METGVSIGKGISAGANSISSPSIGEFSDKSFSTSNFSDFSNPGSNININSPESTFSESFDNFDTFHAFDPSMFEKAPTEFGKTDAFKDTNLVASSLNSNESTLKEFDFSDFEKMITELPTSDIKAENINSSEYTVIAGLSTEINQVENKISEESALEYDFEAEFEEMLTTEFNEENSSKNIESKTKNYINSTALDENYDYFQDLNREDLKTEPVENNNSIEIQTADEAIFIDSEEFNDSNIESNNTNSTEEIIEDQTIIDNALTSPEIEETLSEEENEDSKDEKDPTKEEKMDESEKEKAEIKEEEEEDEDRQEDKKLLFVVDQEANQARINDANEAIDKIEINENKITGEKVIVEMGIKPDTDEISQIISDSNTDGSYTESMADISKKEFNNKTEAKNEIEEVFRAKTAVKIDFFGQEVNKTDVERVLQQAAPANEQVLYEAA